MAVKEGAARADEMAYGRLATPPPASARHRAPEHAHDSEDAERAENHRREAAKARALAGHARQELEHQVEPAHHHEQSVEQVPAVSRIPAHAKADHLDNQLGGEEGGECVVRNVERARKLRRTRELVDSHERHVAQDKEHHDHLETLAADEQKEVRAPLLAGRRGQPTGAQAGDDAQRV